MCGIVIVMILCVFDGFFRYNSFRFKYYDSCRVVIFVVCVFDFVFVLNDVVGVVGVFVCLYVFKKLLIMVLGFLVLNSSSYVFVASAFSRAFDYFGMLLLLSVLCVVYVSSVSVDLDLDVGVMLLDEIFFMSCVDLEVL